MNNENLEIEIDSLNTYSLSGTRSPAMRGLVHGVLLSLAIWTGAWSLVLMFVYHGGGTPVQVTLANPAPGNGN